MGVVIPMFLEDPFTGYKIPNRPLPESFVVIDRRDGSGVSIHKSRNQAINAIAQTGEPHFYAIEHWPGIGVQGVQR